jgi:hypothetical protein
MVSISRITLLVAVSCEGSISCRYNRDLIIIMQSTAPTASGSASVTGGSISFHETSFTINWTNFPSLSNDVNIWYFILLKLQSREQIGNSK